MRFTFILMLVLGGAVACAGRPGTCGPTCEEELAAEASALVSTFVNRQRATLDDAVAAGPYNAVQVCSERAPVIAHELSETSGWDVRRVSLKPRNSSTAIPDDWAESVLRDFEERNARGDAPDTLVHAETVDGEFRYLKAQPVESICLLCHGTDVAEEVQYRLKKLYPDDKATGFELGDLRGALYLRKTL